MKKIYRAVAYERVSTTNEDQANSLVNQRALVDRFLKRHPEFLLVEEPYSEMQSGKSDIRPQYQKMIKRIRRGDIDFLLVKDLKRLCRSNEVSAQIKHLCQNYGFKLVLTSTDQIYDPNAEEYRLLYGFESLINEEMVHRQSMYGRIAHQQKIEAKRLNANDVRFGYRWDYTENKMVIVEEEAAYVRKIFEMFVFENLGVGEVSEKMAEEYGLKGKKSKKLISSRTIHKWLSDPSYKGVFQLNKKGSILGVGVGAKSKRFERPPEEWVSVEKPELQIVPTELYDMAQRIIQERKELYLPTVEGFRQGKSQGFHKFSSVVFCGCCGYPMIHYYTDRKGESSAYRDSYSRHSRDPKKLQCENKDYGRIYESTLEQVALSAINTTLDNYQTAFEITKKAIRKAILMQNDDLSEKSLIEKRIKELEAEGEKIMESFIQASDSLRGPLAKKHERLADEVERLQKKLILLSATEDEQSEYEARFDEIARQLDSYKHLDSIERSDVKAMIYKMVINGDGSIDVHLKTNQIVKNRGQKGQKNETSKNAGKCSNFNVSDISFLSDVETMDLGFTVACRPDMPTAPGEC